MELSAKQIAHLLNGVVEGDDSVKVNNLAKIQEANSSSISFLSNPKYENYAYTTKAAVLIVNKTFTPKSKINATLVRVDDAYTSFSVLLEEYHKIISFIKEGIEQPCFLSPDSSLGNRCYVGAFAYIGNKCIIGDNVKIYPHVYIGDNVTIGNNTIIYAGVKIYSNTQIGKHCTIQAGAVIGSDGFGFAPQPDGTYKSIPQIGNVVIGNHVDIGSNTVIDCATMGSTIIHDGVKLDNLIQIAHNVEIGKNTVIAAQTGISGSTSIGENCMIAGQVGIVGHISIANNTKIGAQSGVSKSLTKPGMSLSGSPAYELTAHLKSLTVFKKLPQLQKRIEELEEKMLHLQSL
ncbi:MAG: UDP-3-O-(3-hydroxymyristoyl)glucosamine N-acyltransferase [Cytophagaceae bacterium]|nr:UDP-3-O-(3-hydroxymyristoyl)glucosamine N-acyltransferase [Cytophagaceae bacterium]MDW8455644.1 UDP-3-O-(3-hydroxymyristoyl)glucosamine N-acyltransferase [Cytophagaceae bacterium]